MFGLYELYFLAGQLWLCFVYNTLIVLVITHVIGYLHVSRYFLFNAFHRGSEKYRFRVLPRCPDVLPRCHVKAVL
jgi:hypothetical protein